MDLWHSSLNAFRQNFHKISYVLFIRYTIGLNVSENKTVDSIANQYVENTDQSNQNRFLTKYPCLKNDFTEDTKILLKEHTLLSSFRFFVIDYTLIEKYDERIASPFEKHYDHSKNGFISGQQALR